MKKLIYSIVILLAINFNLLLSQDANLLWTKTHKLGAAPSILKMSNDEKYLILGYTNTASKLAFYDLSKNDYISDSGLPEYNRIQIMTINPNNELVGIGYKAGSKVFFNYNLTNLSENKTTPFDSNYKNFTTYNISPSGKYIHSYVTDSLLAIWSAETHQIIKVYNKNNGMIPRSLSFSSDDSKAVFYKDSNIVVVDFSTQSVIATFPYKSYLVPYALRLTNDNNIVLADKYDLYFRKYDFQGKQINFISAPFTLDNFDISKDGNTIFQVYTGFGYIFNKYSGSSFIYKFNNPVNQSLTLFTPKEYLILAGQSYIKLISISDTITKVKLMLNNFTETRYFDKNNLYCLQTGGNIVHIDANTGTTDEQNKYELSNVKFVPNNNNCATENYMQRAIRVYKLNDLNGRIDSLRGFINIGNYNFSSDMGYLHISGTTSNYIFNFPEKKELWDKDSANVFWSNWRNYLLTSYSADSLANLIRVRKIPENKEIFNFRIAKAAKYMITKNDEYLYAELTNGTPGASIGWIKYKLSDGLFDNSFKYSDTLYGARSKAMFIRNDNHIFIYSSAAINPEFWIRNANDGSVIYYNKCNINASIRSVSFNDNYQQFTLTFSDGSLSTYKLPDGILDVNEEISSNNGISISPNPASDYIEISLDSPSIKRGLGGVSFEIFNIFGEKISTPSLLRNAAPQEGNIKIDISNLSTGVYFIKIGDKFEKFVKI